MKRFFSLLTALALCLMLPLSVLAEEPDAAEPGASVVSTQSTGDSTGTADGQQPANPTGDSTGTADGQQPANPTGDGTDTADGQQPTARISMLGAPTTRVITTWDDVLSEAKAAPAGGTKTEIQISADMEITDPLTVANGQNIVLKGGTAENPVVLKRTLDTTPFVIAEGGSLTLDGFSLQDDTVRSNGEDSAYINNSGSLTMQNGEIINLQYGPSLSGSIIKSTGKTQRFVDVTVSNCKAGGIVGCTSSGAPVGDTYSLVLERCTVEDCSLGLSAVSVNDDVGRFDVSITESRFENNPIDIQAQLDQGEEVLATACVRLYRCGTVDIRDTQFIKNGLPEDLGDTPVSDAEGGGLCCDSCQTVNVTGCLFDGNIASRGGGAYFECWAGKPVTLTDCTFQNNRAVAVVGDDPDDPEGEGPEGYGGGFCVISYSSSKLILEGTNRVINNTVDGHGGGITLSGVAPFNFGGTVEIIGNTATGMGGGLFVSPRQGNYNDADAFALYDNVLIDGNTAATGGGLFVPGTANAVNLHGVKITNNRAVKTDRIEFLPLGIDKDSEYYGKPDLRYNGSGGGVAEYGKGISLVATDGRDSLIQGNTAESGNGDAMYMGGFKIEGDPKIYGEICLQSLPDMAGYLTTGQFTGTVPLQIGVEDLKYFVTENPDDVANGLVFHTGLLTTDPMTVEKTKFYLSFEDDDDIGWDYAIYKEEVPDQYSGNIYVLRLLLGQPSHLVDYEFVSGTPGKELPEALRYLRHPRTYATNDLVYPIDPPETTYFSDDGVWTFVDYSTTQGLKTDAQGEIYLVADEQTLHDMPEDRYPDEKYREKQCVTFTGTWVWTPGYPLSLEDQTIYTGGTGRDTDNPTFPQPIFQYENHEGAALKLSQQRFKVYGDETNTLYSFQDLYKVSYYTSEGELIESDSTYGDFDAVIELREEFQDKHIIDTDVDDEGHVRAVLYPQGAKLRIRYVSDMEAASYDKLTFLMASYTEDTMETVKQQVEQSGQSGGMWEADSVIKINGKLEYKDIADPSGSMTPAVSLLFDEILPKGQGSSEDYTDLLIQRAKKENYTTNAGETEFKYLDLVDEDNSNVWLSSSDGVEVFWPYPEGTDQNTDFLLLHFAGLHREYGMEGEAKLPEQVDASTVESVTFEKTDKGIWFHIGERGFSPFALTWSEQTQPEKPDEPEKPGDDGQDGDDEPQNSAVTGSTSQSSTAQGGTSQKETAAAPAAVQTATAAIPQTGDSLPVGPLSGVAILSAAAVAMLAVLRKRRSK